MDDINSERQQLKLNSFQTHLVQSEQSQSSFNLKESILKLIREKYSGTLPKLQLIDQELWNFLLRIEQLCLVHFDLGPDLDLKLDEKINLISSLGYESCEDDFDFLFSYFPMTWVIFFTSKSTFPINESDLIKLNLKSFHNIRRTKDCQKVLQRAYQLLLLFVKIREKSNLSTIPVSIPVSFSVPIQFIIEQFSFEVSTLITENIKYCQNNILLIKQLGHIISNDFTLSLFLSLFELKEVPPKLENSSGRNFLIFFLYFGERAFSIFKIYFKFLSRHQVSELFKSLYQFLIYPQSLEVGVAQNHAIVKMIYVNFYLLKNRPRYQYEEFNNCLYFYFKGAKINHQEVDNGVDHYSFNGERLFNSFLTFIEYLENHQEDGPLKDDFMGDILCYLMNQVESIDDFSLCLSLIIKIKKRSILIRNELIKIFKKIIKKNESLLANEILPIEKNLKLWIHFDKSVLLEKNFLKILDKLAIPLNRIL